MERNGPIDLPMGWLLIPLPSGIWQLLSPIHDEEPPVLFKKVLTIKDRDLLFERLDGNRAVVRLVCKHSLVIRYVDTTPSSVHCQYCNKDYGWYCPNPNNKDLCCQYDDAKDTAHDECIYCGQPEERK